MKLSVQKILDICNGNLVSGNSEVIFEKYCHDTRNIKTGDVYVGIKGENLDGNDFIGLAFEKGAVGCITDKPVSRNLISNFKDKIIIQVEDTVKAIQDLASYVRLQYDIPVIAITGSVGKTSTKDIVANVIKQKFEILKTEGNFNNHIGLPLTLLNLDKQTAIVVEMGMNHLGEISLLSNIAKPTLAVITNICTSHIGNLGSRENILKAKLEILDGLKKDGKLLINNDNDLLNEWHKLHDKNFIYTYGIEKNSNFMAQNILQTDNYSSFDVDNNNIKIFVSGKHFIYNALCAYAVGKILNIENEKIIRGIAEFTLTSKRMEIRKLANNSIVIEDYYNSSLESTTMALEVLAKKSASLKIAVLGDILELGSFSKEMHEKVGCEVAKNHIDILITVGSEAINIARQAEKLGQKNVYVCENNKTAIKILKENIKENSAILIKASHGMHFGEIAKELK